DLRERVALLQEQRLRRRAHQYRQLRCEPPGDQSTNVVEVDMRDEGSGIRSVRNEFVRQTGIEQQRFAAREPESDSASTLWWYGSLNGRRGSGQLARPSAG